MSFEIKLNCGRVIQLESINQSETYAGLTLGIPRKKMNDDRIASFRRQTETLFYMPPIVIEPGRTPFDAIPDHPGAAEFLGDREFMPKIVCSALFRSMTVRKGQPNFTMLPFLWFQPDWALPVDAGVLEKMKSTDWDAHAREACAD